MPEKPEPIEIMMPLPNWHEAYQMVQDAKHAGMRGDFPQCKAIAALATAEASYQSLLVQNLMRNEANQAAAASRQQYEALSQTAREQAQKQHEDFIARQFAAAGVTQDEVSRYVLCINACRNISDEDLARGVVVVPAESEAPE